MSQINEKVFDASWIYDLYELGQKSISGQSAQGILDEILRRIAQTMKASSATLATRDEEGNVRIAAVLGRDSCLVGQIVKPNEGVFGQMLRHPAPMVINGPVYDANTSPVPGRTQFPFSAICWPLLADERLIGLLSVNSDQEQIRFSQADMQHGQVLVNLISFIVENIRQHQASQRRIEELIRLNQEVATINQSLQDTQERLLQAEKMAAVGRVSAGIAHEINNPLAFVRSNLGVLKDYVRDVFQALDTCLISARGGEAAGVAKAPVLSRDDIAFLREDISSILEESRTGLDRVATIVKNLRAISHPGTGAKKFVPVNLDACVQDAIQAVAPKLSSRVRVLHTYHQWPLVMGTASMFVQILTNLLTNAAQAIAGEGSIEVTGGSSATETWVDVIDSGRGIAAEDLGRIFEPFFTTREVGEGMGLGLALSYKFAEHHGGRLEVDSTPGQGSRFRLVLPCPRAETIQPSPTPATNA